MHRARIDQLTPQVIDKAILRVAAHERPELVEALTKRLTESLEFTELLESTRRHLPNSLSPIMTEILITSALTAGIEIGYALRDQLQATQAAAKRESPTK